MPEFAFIVYPGPTLSLRERELYKAKAKSHAAKTCQRRRRMTEEREALARQRPKPLAPKKSYELQDAHKKQGPTLYKGNSDPFNATPEVKVTPRIHQIMVFLQHGFLPSTFPAGNKPGWVRGFVGKAHLLERVRSLLSQPVGLSEILPYTTMLAISCGGLQHEVLSLQLQIIQRIQEAMLDMTANLDHLLLFTKALFSAAVIQHDLDAARTHSSAFSHLLIHKIELAGCSSLHFNFVMHTLYYLQELAHITLSRPVIDVSSWVDRYIQHLGSPVIQYLKPFHNHFEDLLDPCISDSCLRKSYRTVYETLWLWLCETQPAPDITQYTLSAYCILQHNNHSIRLVDCFVDFREGLEETASHAQSSTEAAYLVSQAILALSLLTYLATFVSNSVVGSRYLWKKHTVFLSQLRELLTVKSDGLSFEDGEFRTEYRNALLCAYWAGATWELREGDGSAWFSERFCQQCDRMNLRSWRQIEPILNGFMLVKLALPNGSMWVDTMLDLANPYSGHSQPGTGT